MTGTQHAAVYVIMAINTDTGQPVECLTWRGNPNAGIEQAKRDAKEFGKDKLLSQFYALPIAASYCPGCSD